MDLSCDYLKMKHPIAQKALYALLEVKDSDLRLDTVYQGNHAVIAETYGVQAAIIPQE